MKSEQKQAAQMYGRVQKFLEEHPLTAPATYGPAKDLLESAIAGLGDQAGEQELKTRLSRQGTGLQRTLRSRLGLQLRPMVKIAKVALRNEPAVDRALAMPISTTTIALLNAAKAFREIGARYEQVFVEHGMAPDFLAQLDATRSALAAAHAQTGATVALHVGARAGIEQEIRRGRDAVELLDAVVVSTFAGNAQVLGEWANVKKLKYVTRPDSTKAAAGAAGPVSPAPSGAAAVAAVAAVTETPKQDAA